MDRDGHSPKQNFHRCDRCDQWFTDLEVLREHKRSDCSKTLPCKETSSPELPTRQEMGTRQHFDFPANAIVNKKCAVKRSPTEKRVHLSPDQGTSKSPKAVKTPPEGHISSKPKPSLYSIAHFSPDLKRSISPGENSKSPQPTVSPKLIISPPAARKLNFLPDQGTYKSPCKTSPGVAGNTRNSPGSSTPDRDSSRSPCSKALKSATTNRILAEQSWLEASNSAAHFTRLYEAATEEKEKASKNYADSSKMEKSLTVASEVKELVSDAATEEKEKASKNYADASKVEKSLTVASEIKKLASVMKKRAYDELLKAIEAQACALESLEEAVKFETFCRDAASAARVHEAAIQEAAKSYNTGRDKHSAGSPNRKVRFSPDTKTSPSSCKRSKTPPSVVSSKAMNSPGSSSQVDLTQAFAAALEEEKAIAESAKSVKAEGDGNGTNLELKALEGDRKQSESDQTSKNDFPEKALDSVTEKDEALKQSNLEEATNVLHAEDDRIDFTSVSVAHHGRTQRQQSSFDDPDQHQAAEAATSSSHVSERLEQSDKSPESMETTD